MPNTQTPIGPSGIRKDLLVAGSSTAADEVICEIADAQRFNRFEFMSGAGSFDVAVSLDGTNFSARGVALTDRGSTTPATAVVASAANRVYFLHGRFAKVRVYQVGAPAVATFAAIGTIT